MQTKISDVIVPEIFIPYSIQRTMELSAFFQSGIIGPIGVSVGDDLTSGGNTINMPFWNDLAGDDEVLSDSAALTVDKITASKDIAVLHFRGKAWGANGLARQLAGSDPMMAIADLVDVYWARKMQLLLLSTLAGAFSAASMAGNALDISGAMADPTGDANTIHGSTFIDATQQLGDAKNQLAAVAMHSAVQASLAKKDLIVTQRDSQGQVMFDTFMGKRVIVDDGMPVETVTPTGQTPPPPYKVYTSYLFGADAIGYAEGGTLTPVETDRDSLADDDFLMNRRAFVLHPRGIKWKGTCAGASPTNAELAAGTSWERVYDSKAVRIVQFKHRIA
ncbi:MAG: major capsid protein [Synergistaceae bacterium]|jgi:hypothetical protein|nr:major capsid protein [Synergistaceae bacterium]